MKAGGTRICGLASVLALAASGCAQQASVADLNAAYERSIVAAAAHEKPQTHPLQPIDPAAPAVTVAHVQPYPTIDTKRFIWVARPDELQALCRGRADALVAIQEALGLPPQARGDVKVFIFDVRPADLFRPCASSPDTGTAQCSADLPQAPDPTHADAEHFVLKQMMDSYRTGPGTQGYPFTAMGWSYNWDPAAANAQGVSEYVVRPGAMISNVVSATPEAFCARR
ncbi:MAG TPA: hypothetical protein VHS58_20450 [Acetobacteraceae bacterium]|jgi:hypothetical protein|nr:hypothetical protein [Acetobacteraceae bacterium]